MGLFYQNCPVQTRLNDINTVFGWVDFREDGNHREEKWVENSVFHCLAKGENTEDGKPGRKFSLPGHKSHPPKSGGKLWREKCSHGQITEMPSLSQRSQQLNKEEEDNFPTPDSAQFIITTATQK